MSSLNAEGNPSVKRDAKKRIFYSEEEFNSGARSSGTLARKPDAAGNSVNEKRTCTACGAWFGPGGSREYSHPLLAVPVCLGCLSIYCRGDFILGEDGKESYCRWCGDGGELLSCDKNECMKTFCTTCIDRNFGKGESSRLQNGHWQCFACEPSTLSSVQTKYSELTRCEEEPKQGHYEVGWI